MASRARPVPTRGSRVQDILPVRHDARSVQAAMDAFLGSGELPPFVDPVVADSWRRSRGSGLDPESATAILGLPGDDLDAYRSQHPLAGVMPVVRELLVGAAASDGLVVAVSDDVGRLLWVEGSHGTRSTVDRVGFVEGALWREEQVGTNAPGTALATRRAVQVLGAEHFARPVRSLNCVAAPIHDPTGRVLGVLDITGGEPAGSRMMLSLVRAAAGTIERELAATSPHVFEPDRTEVRLLGDPLLHTPDGDPHLSLRHAEILTLLSEHPDGLTGEELAVQLDSRELSEVTVRAEISRLRRVGRQLPEGLLAGSRPYRLTRSLCTDIQRVRSHLAAGDVAAAASAYRAPVLPRSVAPGVERIRAELSAEVRSAVVTSGSVEALDRWTQAIDGRDDLPAWRALLTAAAPGSPQAVRALAHLSVLETDLA
ncbi:GAF domain-containing protein [Ruania alkalisoli]|uniref:GAF domain-containing protein n=2 Tax=Ruania alkalisoli TaxID=2779775 RepID=A0A7M1SQI9_9MICO|nr:GAF domain-containing protein [Ruania alkalisoli]